MIKLTKRQQQILDLIKEHIQETGYPPTRAEIADTFGFRSPNAAEEHLKALAKKGAIQIIPGTSRGIRLPEEPANDEAVNGLPVIGRVAAGSPILAVEQIEEHCQISGDFFNPKADFLLRVQGMSMKNIGIYEGDLIAVSKTDQARNGDIVIARVDEDVTVKRFEQQGQIVWLHPENEELESIRIDLSEQSFTIEGQYVGVIRRSVH